MRKESKGSIVHHLGSKSEALGHLPTPSEYRALKRQSDMAEERTGPHQDPLPPFHILGPHRKPNSTRIRSPQTEAQQGKQIYPRSDRK